MVWLEFGAILLLACSIPFWDNLIPVNPVQTAGVSPVVLVFFIVAVGLNLAGLVMSAPRLVSLPRSVWSGWTFHHPQRTPSLPDISQPWLGVVYAPLFNPQNIKAGRMAIHGLDTTAALASCSIVLLCVSALLASGVTGETSPTVFVLAIPLALLLVSLSFVTGFTVYGIGRSGLEKALKSSRGKHVEAKPSAAGAPLVKNLAWLLQLPYLVCLFGLAASIMPLLSLHLDKSPVSGLTAIFYLVIRAAFLTLILLLLLHAPLKLMMLSSGKAYLAPRVIYAISCVAFFLWLLLDWLFQIP
jgi:hypothetical protein